MRKRREEMDRERETHTQREREREREGKKVIESESSKSILHVREEEEDNLVFENFCQLMQRGERESENER